jgi:hypothetical protein
VYRSTALGGQAGNQFMEKSALPPTEHSKEIKGSTISASNLLASFGVFVGSVRGCSSPI